MAAIGKMKWPISVEVFSPPHLPRNSTPLGCRAESRSMIVAALAEPMPKLTIDRPWQLVAACIGRPSPQISQLNFSAKRSRSSENSSAARSRQTDPAACRCSAEASFWRFQDDLSWDGVPGHWSLVI